MRAHYHDAPSSGNCSLYHDCTTSRPVSSESLHALKYQLYPKKPGSNLSSLQTHFREITQELGFPGEGELLEFDITALEYDSDEEDGPGMPSVREMVDYYTRESVIEPYDILWMFTEGNAFLDIEDPQTKSTIRLTLDEGESVLIPAGALHHYNLENHRDGNLRMWAMYKTSDRACLEADLPPLIFAREAEDHPVRKAYLDSIRSE